MTNWMIKNRQWLMLIVSITIIAISLVDLRHQVSDSNSDNVNLEEQLSHIVDSDVQRTLAAFEYISNDIIRHQISNKEPQKWRERANIITQLAYNDGGVLVHLSNHYGLEETSYKYHRMLNDGVLIWRLAYDTESQSVSLVSGQVVHHSSGRYFVEIEFDLANYPPFIPYQFNAELAYVDYDQKTLLRSYDAFEHIVLVAQGASIPDTDKRVIELENKQLLGYDYWELNGNVEQQYQIIEIPVKPLNGTVKVILNRTDQMISIQDDLFELFATLIALLVMYILSNYSVQFIQKNQKVMNTDVLTGLKNRRSLNNSESQIQRDLVSERYHCYGVMLLDIDHFKSVNDTYGHAVGDKVLTRMGQILQENIRQHDECYRLGGEEFVITVPAMLQSQVIGLAERLRVIVEQDSQLHSLVEGGVTVSIGVSALSTGESLYDSLVKADTQLYKAKSSGRNLVQYPVNFFAQPQT